MTGKYFAALIDAVAHCNEYICSYCKTKNDVPICPFHVYTTEELDKIRDYFLSLEPETDENILKIIS